jgi:Protein of unknown function (DUF2934)
MADPTPDQIRQRAYELWQLAGRPEGSDQEFWYEAERELQNSDMTDCSDERSGTFAEQAAYDAECGPMFNNIFAAFALLAVSAMLLGLAFARSVHRAAS